MTNHPNRSTLTATLLALEVEIVAAEQHMSNWMACEGLANFATLLELEVCFLADQGPVMTEHYNKGHKLKNTRSRFLSFFARYSMRHALLARGIKPITGR